VRREFIDDGRLFCASRDGCLSIALVEAVNELVDGCHHVFIVIKSDNRTRGQDSHGDCNK